MSEEERLAKNIQELSFGKLETRNLDTCMTYGISGLCGKECPKFKDKTCEVYLDTLEKEYNSLQNQLQQKENIIKEVRERAKRELKIAEENIKNSEQWLDVEEEQEHAKRDIHTGKIVKRYMEMFLEILDKENK